MSKVAQYTQYIEIAAPVKATLLVPALAIVLICSHRDAYESGSIDSLKSRSLALTSTWEDEYNKQYFTFL